jgi:hypothetical protein
MTRPTSLSSRACPFATLPDALGAERLVGVGFRCWMTGYQTGEIACWEEAWNVYAATLGAHSARVAMTDLGCWVRKIHAVAGRGIVTFPPGCKGFCRDECVAISMIAASQHKVCPALRACTYALIGGPNVDDVMRETDHFAGTLATLDQHLSPASIAMAGDVTRPASMCRH